ncbi:MAG: rhomboid family intramembrane serine protease [Flavobacteriales bacterium]|nr:rhomboid family intramembrane serine protease [Flavobacteriales bacterium]
MREESVWAYIRRFFKQSGMTGKLLLVNAIVFLFFTLLFLVQELFKVDGLEDVVKSQFAAPGNPKTLIYKPWSVITQLFTHANFAHFAFNMIMFYFSARIFVMFFGERRLLTTYFLGGIFAYLFHIVCYYTIPAFSTSEAPSLIGASASIMAIFMAISFHRPSYRVQLFGIIPVPLIVLAILYIVGDLRDITSEDNIAHLAHLGGALFGALSIININSSKNFMNRFEKWLSKLKMPSFKRKPKMKVHKNDEVRNMTDDQYNSQKKANSDRIDAILDKISKKGYDGLTKEEKEILFNESKRKQ